MANDAANCFMPRPNVGSAVIRLQTHVDPPVKVKNEKLMFGIIRASFNQRRKTLQNSVSHDPGLGISKELIAGKSGKDGTVSHDPWRGTESSAVCRVCGSGGRSKTIQS